jgi:hypothetical protein
MSTFKRVLVFFILLTGVFFLAVCIHSIIDPGSAQLANDSEPFGKAPGIQTQLGLILGALVCVGIGLLFLKKSRQFKNGVTH